MRVNVLGLVEAVDGNGSRVRLGPRKQRLLLAVLACRPGETVPTVELTDALWGESPPRSAGENLRGYVQGLRRALGAEVVVGQRRPGYLLAVDPRDVDRVEFVRSARDGAAALRLGDAAAARTLLHHGLGLWRGTPFADVEAVAVLAAETVRLEEHRLTALEDRIDADLQTGSAGLLVPELDELTRQHPYRERFYSLLMLALYRSGRQADALGAYRRAREVLIGDLGIEPGEELRRTEQAILRGEAWLQRPAVQVAVAEPEVVPAELPAVADGFTARLVELARLDELTGSGGGAGGAVVAIVGIAGVGKTALAVQWGHRSAGRFPDGQLFVDLRGFHPAAPVQPGEALARLLRTFAVEPARIPPSADEAAALYRSVLARRRVLIVLDNAVSAEQVRPLLPGHPDCVVLVTSRNRMPGLVAGNAAAHLALDPLSSQGAAELLRRVLEPSLVRAEPAAVADLARACGHLPLALRIAAANIAEHPDRTLAQHVAALQGAGRLDALQVDGDDQLAVRTAFDLSYAALTAQQQRMFRLLGLVPGPDVTAAAAAALAGYGPAETRRCLDRLAAAHLLQRRPAERFALHDLIRDYAADRAAAADPADRQAAIDRLFTHYIDATDAAARVLYPQILRLPSPTGSLPSPAGSPPTAAPASSGPPAPPAGGDMPAAGDMPSAPPAGDLDRAEALDWCAAELPNLVAACRHAADHGPARAAWLIGDAIGGYCWLQSNVTDWTAMAHAAHRAAATAGDLAAQTSAIANLAHCYQEAGDLETSTRYYEQALPLSRRARWPEAEAKVIENAATAYGEMGDLKRAVDYQQTALAVHRRTGQRHSEGIATLNLGLSFAWLGRLTEAHDLLSAAADLLRDGNWLMGRASGLINLAETLVLMDRRDEARKAITEARQVAWQVGKHVTEIHALVLLSTIRRLDGDAGGALRQATEARAQVRLPGEQAAASEVHRAIAAAHEALGDLRQAVAHYRIAHQHAAAMRSRYNEIEALIGLAAAEHRTGEPGAEATLRRALANTRTIGYRVLEGRVLAALAEIDRQRRDLDAAAGHARLALAIQDETGWRLGRSALHDILGRAGDPTPHRRS